MFDWLFHNYPRWWSAPKMTNFPTHNMIYQEKICASCGLYKIKILLKEVGPRNA